MVLLGDNKYKNENKLKNIIKIYPREGIFVIKFQQIDLDILQSI